MDAPLRPDEVLGQPTRARVFNLLGELRRPAGTGELAARLDLHPNGVRVHLGRLLDAGLVTRDRTRRARGRPRDLWSIAPAGRPGGRAPTGYVDLGGWLARVIESVRPGGRRIEAAGRRIGRELVSDTEAPPEQTMYAVLSSLGFEPRRRRGAAGTLTYRLCNCPYREAVRQSPDVVCGLHRGVTQGLLEVIDPSTRLVGFVARDPEVAGCLIELEGGLAGARPSAPKGLQQPPGAR